MLIETRMIGTTSHKNVPARQRFLDQFCEQRVVSVPFNKFQVIDAVLKIIGIGSRPFTILEEEGFLDIFQPIFQALKSCITRFNISGYIHNRSEEIRKQVTKLISEKAVSIKIDCATRMDRSFIGINIQFVHKSKIVIFTLSALEVHIRHTGENLKRIILEELERYNVKATQIYTVTTDNGSNLLCAVKLMRDAPIEAGNEETDDEENEEDIDEDSAALSDTIQNAAWSDKFIIST